MRYRWFFDLLVLTLIVYFGAEGVRSVLKARLTPGPIAEPAAVGAAATHSQPLQPLEAYAIIWERNLFGGAAREQATPRSEEVSLEQIPLALKGLGLKLVGTAVSGRPAEDLAIIEDLGSRKQKFYHEGDRVKQALIRRILRENVIINTGTRDEMLTMKPEESPEPPAPSMPAALSGSPRVLPAGPVQLAREEVESSLADLSQVMQQVRIRPYLEGNRPAGLLVSQIKPGSILAKMGLRSGDVIQRINDNTITSPEQAAELFQGLMEGGEIALQIKRGRRSEELHFEIR